MLKVRKIEILVEDGLVVLEADGTEDWINITGPSGLNGGRRICQNPIKENECTLDELARAILLCDGEERPTARRVAFIIVQIAPVIW